MRNRMLVVAIGLIVLLVAATSAAFAQQGDAENSGDTAVGPDKDQIIRELQVEAATAGKLAADTQEKLDAADAKLGVAGDQIAAEQAKSAALQAALDAKQTQKVALQKLNTAQAARAMHTGRPEHWQQARKSATQLDKLNAEIQGLDKRISWVEQNPLGGEAGQHKMWDELNKGGVRSESYLVQKYGLTPKTPAKPGKPITQPADPAKESKTMDVNSMLYGALILAAVIGLIYAFRQSSLNNRSRELLKSLTTKETSPSGRYDEFSAAFAADGTWKVEAKGIKTPPATTT